MATKTKKSSRAKTKTRRVPVVMAEPVVVAEQTSGVQNTNTLRYVVGGLAVLLLLVLYWWKTNTWPVVALVDNQPVFRWQLDQMLYAQAGQQALDSLIVEKLIENEIASKRIEISASEVDAKIAEIKTQIGSEEAFTQALAAQGMTEEALKKQFRLQIGLEKLVEPSTDSAVLQERIYDYVEGLRGSNRVKNFVYKAE